MTIYHMINWFFAFSLFGYLLECIVLSYENKTMVLNRGFGHGPFCIIYGFGAMGAYALLQPLAGDFVKLYFASMIMATTMELVTAYVMIRLFGAFWWDYSQKPFNYKGIICLESSIGWGFLGIVFFRFLDGFVNNLVGRIPQRVQGMLALGLLIFYVLDFTYSVREALREARSEEDSAQMIGRLKIY